MIKQQLANLFRKLASRLDPTNPFEILAEYVYPKRENLRVAMAKLLSDDRSEEIENEAIIIFLLEHPFCSWDDYYLLSMRKRSKYIEKAMRSILHNDEIKLHN